MNCLFNGGRKMEQQLKYSKIVILLEVFVCYNYVYALIQ